MNDRERMRRWQLAVGDEDAGAGAANALSDRDRRLSAALSALYGTEPKKGKGGLGASAPRVARWLGDIREFFPSSLVQVIQKDAFERLNLKSLLMEPEFLETLEADVHLVADLMSLRSAIPEKTKGTARMVVQKVVDDLMKRLRHRTVETLRGALDRQRRTRRPRHGDVDWPRTIGANLRHYQAEHRTIVPETLIGFARKSRTRADLDQVILCVDQSGSMASSVVYASIFAAVMASLPVISTKLVCFDTAIIDLTEHRSGGGAVRRAIGRRHRHQRRARLLRRPDRTAGQYPSRPDQRSLRGRKCEGHARQGHDPEAVGRERDRAARALRPGQTHL